MSRARAAGPNPVASAVIAVRDGGETIAGAVTSVLRQTIHELEVIVVNDGSKDETREILERFTDPRLRVINLEACGRAMALTLGLEEARGAVVFRLDADDLAMGDRFERQLEAFRNRPDISILGTTVLTIDRGRIGRLAAPLAQPDSVRWSALFGSPFLHPTVAFNKEHFQRADLLYDEEFDESEDYDLWTRALKSLRGANLNTPLTLYRVHPAQASQRHRARQRELQQLVARRTMESWFPELGFSEAEFERVWAIGVGEPLESNVEADAMPQFLTLLERFCESAALPAKREVTRWAARLLARRAFASGSNTADTIRIALRLDPLLPLAAPRAALRRRLPRRARLAANDWMLDLGSVAPS